jgi:hypothetical protein
MMMNVRCQMRHAQGVSFRGGVFHPDEESQPCIRPGRSFVSVEIPRFARNDMKGGMAENRVAVGAGSPRPGKTGGGTPALQRIEVRKTKEV